MIKKYLILAVCALGIMMPAHAMFGRKDPFTLFKNAIRAKNAVAAAENFAQLQEDVRQITLKGASYQEAIKDPKFEAAWLLEIKKIPAAIRAKSLAIESLVKEAGTPEAAQKQIDTLTTEKVGLEEKLRLANEDLTKLKTAPKAPTTPVSLAADTARIKALEIEINGDPITGKPGYIKEIADRDAKLKTATANEKAAIERLKIVDPEGTKELQQKWEEKIEKLLNEYKAKTITKTTYKEALKEFQEITKGNIPLLLRVNNLQKYFGVDQKAKMNEIGLVSKAMAQKIKALQATDYTAAVAAFVKAATELKTVAEVAVLLELAKAVDTKGGKAEKAFTDAVTTALQKIFGASANDHGLLGGTPGSKSTALTAATLGNIANRIAAAKLALDIAEIIDDKPGFEKRYESILTALNVDEKGAIKTQPATGGDPSKVEFKLETLDLKTITDEKSAKEAWEKIKALDATKMTEKDATQFSAFVDTFFDKNVTLATAEKNALADKLEAAADKTSGLIKAALKQKATDIRGM
ncbi:MAG: hypothetical protein UU47_C0005G0028 [candidate division TM6 bacterium GW2011_GWE2_41_16]|nr:MAG: hypothetical protein UU47_C0005G0028 [candidate division TM6 bacterium GW2011_GWE2_41_16]